MARDAVYSLIVNDSELNSLGIDSSNTYGSNATDTPSRKKNFVVINMGDGTKVFGQTGYVAVVIWAHQPVEIGRYYTAIDAILERIKVIMSEAQQVVGADGWRLTSASWQGRSIDLFDDGYKSLARHDTYRVASNYSGYVSAG